MHIFCLWAGIICIVGTLGDSFQTVIVPRRAVGKFRFTRLFYLYTWWPWSKLAGRVRDLRRRETALSYYGPMALIILIVIWAFTLVLGFGLIYFGLGSPFRDPVFPHPDLRSDLYVSGTTLFTLGLGDLVPHNDAVRMLAVLESGMGLGFLALVIGYFPVLYGAFSRREVNISLLDARAGSPPTAAELMRRHAFEGGNDAMTLLLIEWERWAAELLESHISYPLLCYFRSQHSNQSWIAALTSILDTCSLLIAGVQEHPARQAQLTFAVARHALVDLSQVFGLKPSPGMGDRLPPERFEMLYGQLCQAGIRVCRDEDSMARLKKMRLLYEGYADTLSTFLCMPLPPWIADQPHKDNWLSVAKVRAATEAVASGHVNKNSGLQPLFVEDEEHHIF